MLCHSDDNEIRYFQTETSTLILDSSSFTAVKLAVAITVPVGAGLISASIQTVLVVQCKEQTFFIYTNFVSSLSDYHVGILRLKHAQCLPIYLISGNPPKGDRRAFETGLTPDQLVVEVNCFRFIINDQT